MAKLVILRGNSGSGKTATAKALQAHYGRRTLLISQDMIRRDMLKEKVEPGNLSVSLTKNLAQYGYEQDLLVLIEGFYETDIYGDMLQEVRELYSPHVLSYYYDLSFEETVRRHATRAKSTDFTADDMRRWWVEKDTLGWSGEMMITDQDEFDKTLSMVIEQIDRLN